MIDHPNVSVWGGQEASGSGLTNFAEEIASYGVTDIHPGAG